MSLFLGWICIHTRLNNLDILALYSLDLMAKKLRLLFFGLLTLQLAFLLIYVKVKQIWHYTTDNLLRRWNSSSNHRVTLADLPSIEVSSVNCTALFRGDKNELTNATKFQDTNTKYVVDPIKFVLQAINCTQFIAERHYLTSPVNSEEAEFPIAFSILMFKDVEQFERLLRAIYRPQNFYCIHVDNKSSSEIHAAVNMIAHCFENVFVLQPSFNVLWGTFSVLEPELACMKRLLQRSKNWRYFINLTGQEFPLKTNWQIVRILKAFNGSNNIEGTFKRFALLKYIVHAIYCIQLKTQNNGNVNIITSAGNVFLSLQVMFSLLLVCLFACL